MEWRVDRDDPDDVWLAAVLAEPGQGGPGAQAAEAVPDQDELRARQRPLLGRPQVSQAPGRPVQPFRRVGAFVWRRHAASVDAGVAVGEELALGPPQPAERALDGREVVG